MRFLGERGQEAAPFELLIAVILMGFVIVVGIGAMSELEKQKCYQESNKKMEELKEALETVSKGKGQYNLSFVLPSCGRNAEAKLESQSDPYLCSTFCGGSVRTCTLARLTAENVSSIVKCLNISPLTTFASQVNPSYCPDRSEEDLLLEHWKEGPIPQGDYILASAYVIAERPIPMICAYRKSVYTD
jgi:hypothetical protein